MLRLDQINAGYGVGQVLFDLSMEINAGECVSLMGRNGMGKTTTVSGIMGQLPLQGGSISRFGISDSRLESYEIARLGFGLVPEGRMIFSNLSVAENLRTFFRPADASQNTEWTFDAVLDMFPRLGDRLDHAGSHLSGGEQQMLAIGRALVTNPKLLILDEATEGLAPIIRQDIWACLSRLREQGQSILIIDKNLKAVAALADRHYILEKGSVAWHGNSPDLLASDDMGKRYLGV